MNVSDRWRWLHDIVGGYSVRGAYQILTNYSGCSFSGCNGRSHLAQASKVCGGVWDRLLWDRLPTKINLLRHGIIQPAPVRCVAGCGVDESAPHMFIHCDIFGSLWQHIRTWIAVSGVDPYNIRAHFIQFTNSVWTSQTCRSFMQLIWLLGVWIVWNERNNMIFNNIQTSMIDLLDKVKYNSFWLLIANHAYFVYDSQRWWLDPLLCLSIDWLSLL